MTADVPDALADPVGVAVALVSATEPGLGRDVIEAAVTGGAPGGPSGAGSPRRSPDGRGSSPMAGPRRRGSPETC